MVHVLSQQTRRRKLADGSVGRGPVSSALLVISSGRFSAAVRHDRPGHDPGSQEALAPDLALCRRTPGRTEQVFRAAYLAEFAEQGALEHLGFWHDERTGRQAFKTRARAGC